MPTTVASTKPARGQPAAPISPSSSFRRRRSGYEPSDTESEWHDSPWHEPAGVAPANTVSLPRSKSTPRDAGRPALSPLRSQSHGRNHNTPHLRSSRKTSPLPRRVSRSPFEPAKQEEHGGDDKNHKSNHTVGLEGRQRHVSPYRTTGREEPRDLSRRDDTNRGSFGRSQRMTPPKFRDTVEDRGVVGDHVQKASRASSSVRSQRSKSVPKPRAHLPQQPPVNPTRRQDRSVSPLGQPQVSVGQRQNPSAGEINEMIANAKLSKSPSHPMPTQKTESTTLDDIFFSRDGVALQKNFTKEIGSHGRGACPNTRLVSDGNGSDRFVQQRSYQAGGLNQIMAPVSPVLSRTNTNASSHFGVGRHSSSGVSNDSSRTSDGSGSFRKFTANRQKHQIESWFPCMNGSSCRKSKSPETRAVDEASYIERAFVVEELRQFWADKHQPRSLSGFICHKQKAQLLKQMISYNNCPHIILRGPPGSGKKSLAMALLNEIFGDSSEKISQELRHFFVQEARSTVAVPLTSSPHHVELDIRPETKNARYALMGLVKEIAKNYALTPEFSDSSLKAEYKVIVLYANDKVAESIQHLIKWVMDCYNNACKIILCCEDENNILESVRSRCKLISVDAPETHEIVEVLFQIAKKENFELSRAFAVTIATKSKQNLRKAIMALESCKADSYPFVDEQPMPIGWEQTLIEVASDVLANPSPKRLVYVRGKLQKLLAEFVHPKLILQMLVQQFLKGVQACFRRELYYWHAYYDKRLPSGTSALLKLEEFVAKFMSIQRRGSPDRLVL